MGIPSRYRDNICFLPDTYTSAPHPRPSSHGQSVSRSQIHRLPLVQLTAIQRLCCVAPSAKSDHSKFAGNRNPLKKKKERAESRLAVMFCNKQSYRKRKQKPTNQAVVTTSGNGQVPPLSAHARARHRKCGRQLTKVRR